MSIDPLVNHNYDFVVIGSGAAGLTAALVASIEGLKVLVIEKTDVIGGTAARSSGTVWIPNNSLQKSMGIDDTKEKSMTYLDSLVGGKSDRLLRESFVDKGPQMIDYLIKNTNIRFRPYASSPDYRQDHPGAAAGGRPLEPQSFDGRLLGIDFEKIASPLKELMLFGGIMITRGEAAQLIKLNLNSFLIGFKLITRFLIDRISFNRGTRLVLGNGLVGSLLKELLSRQVSFITSSDTKKIITNQLGNVCGVIVVTNDLEINITASKGILLAGGGFPSNKLKRQQYLPQPSPLHSAAYDGCQGETIDLGLSIGGILGKMGLDNALWFPSSLIQEKDGAVSIYPHIVLDRSKPGLIAVNVKGKRFVNEAVSYHEFVRAMYKNTLENPSIPAVLVCGKEFIWKYGFGLIRPRTPSLKKYIQKGYLYEGNSIEDLAIKVGVDSLALNQTISSFNTDVVNGRDNEFLKGENIYDRSNGDPNIHPNPCLGLVSGPPFYAIKVYPTPLGTSLGLVNNQYSQVLDCDGHPISGLYVAGNDMQSVMGGEYPGAGAQIGVAMTFGYLAAKHAAG